MMRAVRFSAQLGYEIEEQTCKAIRQLAPNLCHISAERIQAELVKLVISPHPENLRIAWETGITAVILPEFNDCMKTQQHNPHHCYSVGEHTLKAMEAIRADKVLRLTMLFHDIGKPEKLITDEKGIDHFYGHPALSEEMSRNILRRLKFDNHTIHLVSRLVRYHDYKVEPVQRNVRRAIMKVGEDIFPYLFEVKQADIDAQSDHLRQEKLKNLEDVRRIYEQIIEEQQCVSLKTLAVTGKDLIEAGMKPGKELGEVLQRLLDFVVEDPSRNKKELLLKEAFEISL